MVEKKLKILILKTGYSEILDSDGESRKTSLGDILRTTVLLHKFKEDNVTWATDHDAVPLLKGNPLIQRLLEMDYLTIEQLKAEEFDKVINLEKVPGICALFERIKTKRARYGFTLNSYTGKAEAYDRAFEVLAVSANPEMKKENQRTTQELLYEMIGEKWNGEEYSLGYAPKTKEINDLCLNTQVGEKWPTKEWSGEKWDELEDRLKKDGYSVSRQPPQEKLPNLYLYMDWINSHKLVISNDSLGMHLGIALKKKVLGLFGPTPHKEIYFYGRGKAILPEKIPECLPCFKGQCENKEKYCMKDISVDRVYNESKEMLKNG